MSIQLSITSLLNKFEEIKYFRLYANAFSLLFIIFRSLLQQIYRAFEHF